MAGDTLRLGCVSYLNARPLISGWKGNVIYDQPAALCLKLAASELDIALVSSFEFLRNPVYQIVQGVAIASRGPVYSVFVASRSALAEVRVIERDPASVSSNALLRIILEEAKLPEILVTDRSADDLLPDDHGRLFIGDPALHFRAQHGSRYRYWDLGEEWTKRTTLPFVYALWLAQPDIDLGDSARELREVRDKNMHGLSELAALEPSFPAEFTERYWRENLLYSLGPSELDGFRLFEGRAQALGLLPHRDRELHLI